MSRSASSSAAWFKGCPELEAVSRDRAGLYADAVRQGAPQARQIADRFHVLKNFRDTIERQVGRFEAPIREAATQADEGESTQALGGPAPRSQAEIDERLRRARRAAKQASFAEIRSLYEAGDTVPEIARKLGLGARRVGRWVCRVDFPERNVMAPNPCTPAYFGTFLARSWAEGTTKVRHLFSDIRRRGYTGSYSHLARFVAPWRGAALPEIAADPSTSDDGSAPRRVCTLDPTTGRQISPMIAAALCVKPRGQMTSKQITAVDALKAASAEFSTMRSLAMRLRGLFRGGTARGLDLWLNDARRSNIHGMRRFARTIRQDLEAVRNAVSEAWSNGQTEGQINRLKMLKRAMYGRAGIDLLRARMLPMP